MSERKPYFIQKTIAGWKRFWAAFTLVDTDGVPFSATNPLPVTGDSGGGGTTAVSQSLRDSGEYSTEREDFTAEITDGSYDIVLSVDSLNGQFITDNNIAAGVLKVLDASELVPEWKSITLDKFSWDQAAKTLNVTNCTNSFEFNAGDLVSLALAGPVRAYNGVFNSDYVEPISNAPKVKTSEVRRVLEQDVTEAYLPFGPDLACPAHRFLGLRVDFVVNDSDEVDVKLVKVNSAGVATSNIDGVDTKRVFSTGDTDGSTYYEFDTGTCETVRILAKAGTAGVTSGNLTIYTNLYDI